MPTSDARLARLEEQVSGVREDLSEVVQELARARQRLHNLEGLSAAFVESQKENRRKEADQYRTLGIRIQIAGLLLTLAAIVSPIVAVLIVGK